ncbi:MAG: D-alanyl-D-alanine carboxypeptidase family protein [Clostridia bacterium]|nr:D-alanyl-D-alanine carboxypeptidase family protein [Clostridia bacterium]
MRLTRSTVIIAIALIIMMFPVCVLGDYDSSNPQNLEAEDITGRAAIVVDQTTGEILFSKNADRQLYPASTTKIMTCLIALERCELDEVVTVPQVAVNIPYDSSRVPVRAGEEITMLDLLYGMMIKSGNDAAIAIAVHISGSIEAFAEVMNERARQIGCQNTNFVNPHGYHDPDHVTTAYDMSLIARTAMQNRTFREIASAKTYTMASTNYREKLRLETPISMYVATNRFYYPDLVGIKTGYHSKAGYCFVGASEKDGVGLISVVFRTDENGRWRDTTRLMDYADTRYVKYDLSQLIDKAEITASIQNSAADDEGHGLMKLALAPGSTLDGYYLRLLPEHEDETIKNFASRLTIEYTSDLQAPISQGDILGTLRISGQSATARLIATRDVLAASGLSVGNLFSGAWLYIVLGIIAVAIIVAAVVKIRARAAKRRRRMEMLRRKRAAYEKYRSVRR